MAPISRQVGLLRDEQRGTARLQMNEGKLEAFKESFLGEDREKCKLLNPGVLSFEAADEESVVLQATTDQPLEVMNRRLGYRLRVVLDRFTVAESGRTTTVLSDALVSFEPLPPGDEGVAERWRETRHAAYQGNRVHLLRALGAGGRRGVHGRPPGGGGAPHLRQLGGAPHVRMIRLEERHRVRHEGGAAWYLSLSEDVERFTVLGQPLAPGAVQTEGYWPVRPVCRRVPANYVPEDS